MVSPELPPNPELRTAVSPELPCPPNCPELVNACTPQAGAYNQL